jgi:hypothetical protein
VVHIYMVSEEGFTTTSHLVSAIISYVFWLFKDNILIRSGAGIAQLV